MQKVEGLIKISQGQNPMEKKTGGKRIPPKSNKKALHPTTQHPNHKKENNTTSNIQQKMNPSKELGPPVFLHESHVL